MENGTSEEIKADSDALEKAFYSISEKLYQQQQTAGGQGAGFDPNAGAGFNANAGAGANGGGDDTVYNADFEDKTGDNK